MRKVLVLLTLEVSLCFPAHNSKVCKVNNVEVIQFLVLITKNCFAPSVTSLCGWLKSVGYAA